MHRLSALLLCSLFAAPALLLLQDRAVERLPLAAEGLPAGRRLEDIARAIIPADFRGSAYVLAWKQIADDRPLRVDYCLVLPHLPELTVITDKEEFTRLWKDWMGKKAVPDVDFDKHVVMVATFRHGRIGGLHLRDFKGDARGVATLGPTPVKGFTFAIAVFKRGGI